MGTAILKLSKVAVTGGIDEVITFVIKTMAKKIWKILDEKYSIESTAVEWGKKAVNLVKSQLPQTLLPPIIS
ncbi:MULTISPECIES: hypothetical protein [Haloferax]|uniref:hypothetical protein n=1 Tax=Haloferax TaxID=2251 RepID=UPI00165FDFCA|nr:MULTISPECIES: hypothetical protein [Haloferax]MBC9986508.1 hypothetical protein [Haloferax sp. AS1]